MSLVTVCIPTITKREDMLERAVKSVEAQTYQPAELIVMKDENYEGPAEMRNRMAQKVKTKYIAWLDDDDEFKPEHLDRLVNCAEEHAADVVYPWYDVEGGGDPLRAHFGKEWTNKKPILYPIGHIVRTEFFLQVGGFPIPDYASNPKFGGEDWDFITKIVKHDPLIVHLPERTWIWHHTGKNTSGLPRKARKL